MSRDKIDSSLDESALDAPESQIGLSSQEQALTDAESAKLSAAKSKKRFFESMTLYDAMLLVALLCVTLATIRLFFAFSQYGGYIWQAPWQVEL